MEKSIKCLKEEVSKLRGYAVIIDGEDGEWEPVTTVSVGDIYELINQLDKIEVLSDDWIDEHSNGPSRSRYVWVDDLKEILVPKQEDLFNGEKPDEGEVYFAIGLEGAVEINSAISVGEAIERLAECETNYSVSKKPVIPKFVANWIEENKKQNRSLVFAIKHIYDENEIGKNPNFFIWMETDDNEETFARAWLGGYTVEEEQLFYVVGKDNTAILSKGIDGNPYPREGVFSDYFVGHEDYMLTEQEIKDYDPRYMTFAKPVEEMEE